MNRKMTMDECLTLSAQGETNTITELSSCKSFVTAEDNSTQGPIESLQKSLGQNNEVEDYVLNLMKSKSVVIQPEVSTQPFSNLAASAINRELRLTRSNSLALASMPQISVSILTAKPDSKDVQEYDCLIERGIIRNLIKTGEIDRARPLIETLVPDKQMELIEGCLHALHFFNLLKKGDLESAVRFSQTILGSYKDKKFKLQVLDE